jgi:subtilisin family serine protease
VGGTSPAAARMAGVAAIIKQKFPALSSHQIAQIILLSADKDMNNDGIPDFAGVDPILVMEN